MGIRFRKSVKIAPGIKLNFGKNSVGISAGGKGARVSVNSKGRVTKSVGIPGTGFSYVETSKLGGSFSKSKKKAVTESKVTDNSAEKTTPSVFLSPATDEKKGCRGILRWIGYFMIVFIATGINANLCFPGMLIVGLIHLYHVRKTYAEKKRKRSTIITCCYLAFCLFGCLTPTSSSAPDIESITLSASQDAMDINEEQFISLTYDPEGADTSNIIVEVSDDDLAVSELTEDGQISLKTLQNEGEFTLLAKSNSIESNKLTFTVVDAKKAEEERIAAEKKAEEERIAAEQKAAEEKAAVAAAQQPQQLNSRTVYVTPTGKRYHYSSSCGNGSYSTSTLDRATAMGLTPCKKCAR